MRSGDIIIKLAEPLDATVRAAGRRHSLEHPEVPIIFMNDVFYYHDENKIILHLEYKIKGI